MRRAAHHVFAGLTFLALLGDHSRASAPVRSKETACVIDGFMITLDGYQVSPMTAVNAPLNLTPYAGQKISLGGELSPGGRFKVTSKVTVLGECGADEKLKLLPVLADIYRRQAYEQPPTSPPPAPLAPKTPILECADVHGESCYQLVRVPKSGGSATVLSRAPLVGHLFVDAQFVYWTEGVDYRDWRMMRRSKTSGRTTAIARGGQHGPLARAPDGFYGDVGRGGFSVLPDNGKPRQLRSGFAHEVAVDGDAVYWSESEKDDSRDLFARDSAGGPSHLLVAGFPDTACRLVASAGRLYWADLEVPPFGGAQIVSMSAQGGSQRVLVGLMMHPATLAVDARSLYWVVEQGGGYALYSAPIDGGAAALKGVAPAVETNTRQNRNHVEIDATHVYWNARTNVARVAKSGGAVEVVASVAGGNVMDFAIDDHDVYLAVVIFLAPDGTLL